MLIFLELNIDVIHELEELRPYTVKQSWHKASDQDLNIYKNQLDELLGKVTLDEDLLFCRDIHCVDHRDMICDLYNTVISSCIEASKHIPTTSKPSIKVKPGWNDNVQKLKDEALSYHRLWKSNGCPREGYFAEMRRITRARYHRAIRHIEKNANTIRMGKMANALLSNKSRDMWSECANMKGKNCKMASMIDGNSDSCSIAGMFSDKYAALYNSVPYDKTEMKRIEAEVMTRLQKCNDDSYNITVHDVMNAVTHLKTGKSDGSEGLSSDHFIHGNRKLYVLLSILFTLFLRHGFSPNSMILGTMIPIPKDKKKSLCSASNYRAIAVSSIFSKILDWIILLKEEHSLCSSELQFGFKKGLSTTQCTFSMLEIIDYYNFNKSDVGVLLLDASKAFDRVNYCKLFNELLKRNISPVLLRLLLYMYTTQSLRVKWSDTTSPQFTVMNGVKQGGVLSPILFAIYTDGLLFRLEDTGVGCHMGCRFTGALAYADDITLLAPCKSALSLMIDVCEQYAAEFDILFNGSKSKLLFFKGRYASTITSGIMVNGEIVHISDNAVHLGHNISTSDRDSMILAAKRAFWKSYNNFVSNFGHLYSLLKISVFAPFCCSFYGSPLWLLNSTAVHSLCVDWRKSLRMLWRVHPMTHCDIIAALSNQLPLHMNLEKRFTTFIKKCLSSTNSVVNIISNIAICNPMSTAGKNYRSVLDVNGQYNNNQLIHDWNLTSNRLKNLTSTLSELIDIRDGYKECDGLTCDGVNAFILDLCTN